MGEGCSIGVREAGYGAVAVIKSGAEGRATDLRKENGLRVGEEESELAWLHVPHLGKLAEPMTVIHLGTGFRR